MNKDWISVKDGLPKNDNELILCDGEVIMFGVYMNGVFTGLFDNINSKSITHWMDFPEIPKDNN